MRIGLTSVYVDNLDKALRFYTDVLGFATKADFTNGSFRWLTVASSEDPDGTGATIATLNDTCGNLIQVTQLARW
jgi:catechol 2,3-dioxygenase-like lactoylglutathione lyase family enzyme